MNKGIYKFFVKLLGAGISSVILFLPLNLAYHDNTIELTTKLTAPVTKEIIELSEAGFEFKIKYYCVIIINDKKTYIKSMVRSLKYDKNWQINNQQIKKEDIQEEMGRINVKFENIILSDKDEIMVYIKAFILPDKLFTRDVGMSTRILWNHYVPRKKAYFIYKEDRLIKK